ncbi:hypothetical protein HMPREF0401_01051 [Fusobacterium animalis 11_3_2]|uniref:Uncharacterized protein n=1 Tax=Fusobacterium animalis 11_3_2 TaxID=457403 RepID=F7KZH2_9FUSO|nr:hypothetical protein [Fusobacterium animalis]EGN67345.1 hypothetical protein HMPREF0401_01051 [Fusobacterium animalis 11_3_2]
MFDNNVIKILLIFFPGIVGVILINYAINTYKSFELYLGLLYSFVLGVLSYITIPFLNKIFPCISLFEVNGDIFKMDISEKGIFLALIISIIYSIIIIKVIDKELYHTFLRQIGVSRTAGKKYILKNLYTTTDNELSALVSSYVDIRFQNKDLTYSGTIKLIDIHDNGFIEILLENAGAIYNNNEDFSYTVKSVIICEKMENLIIEYRNQ